MTTDVTPQYSRADRALGALVGLAVGDALGTTIEFSPRDSLPPVTDLVGGGPFGLEPGEWTVAQRVHVARGPELTLEIVLQVEDVFLGQPPLGLPGAG